MSGGDKFQSAKAAQGYVSAQHRPRCETCTHMQVAYGSALQCRRGGYLVTRFGHCQVWTPRPAASFHTTTEVPQ